MIKLDLLPLSFRREYLDLIFVFNSLFDIHAFDMNTVARLKDDSYLRSGDSNILVSNLPIPRTELYMNFFTNRIVPLWNRLPLNTRLLELNDSGNNSTFKKELKEYLVNKLENEFNSSSACTWLTICRCVGCRA